jgi:hypothetical protein
MSLGSEHANLLLFDGASMIACVDVSQANKVLRSRIHHIVTIDNANPAPRLSVDEAKAALAQPALCIGEDIEVAYALIYP